MTEVRQVLDDELPALHVQVSAPLEGTKDLVHALARTADHVREIGLGQLEIELDVFVSGAMSIGHANQELGNPPVEIEEDEIGGLLGEPAKDGA